MKRNLWKLLGTISLLVSAALIPMGCDNPDTSELDGYFESHPFVNDPRTTSDPVVSINPNGVIPISSIGGRVIFSATGGSGGYSWDVTDTSVGTITPSGDSQAIYAAVAIGDNQVIVYDRSGNAAIAYISGGAQSEMTIKAEPTTLSTDYAMSILTVTGGVAPFTWTVSDTGPGNVTRNTGVSVPYQRYRAGDNAITVTDSTGESRSLIISQR